MVSEDDQGVGAHRLGDAIATLGRIDLEVLSFVHRLVEDEGEHDSWLIARNGSTFADHGVPKAVCVCAAALMS